MPGTTTFCTGGLLSGYCLCIFIALGIGYIQTKLNEFIIRIIKLGWINNECTGTLEARGFCLSLHFTALYHSF